MSEAGGCQPQTPGTAGTPTLVKPSWAMDLALIPQPALSAVLQFLSPRDLCRVSCCSHALRQLIDVELDDVWAFHLNRLFRTSIVHVADTYVQGGFRDIHLPSWEARPEASKKALFSAMWVRRQEFLARARDRKKVRTMGIESCCRV